MWFAALNPRGQTRWIDGLCRALLEGRPDVRRLLDAVSKLVDAGTTVVVIEHNPDVIKCADHIVDPRQETLF